MKSNGYKDNKMTNRSLIKDWLPIKEISVEAVREGGTLEGHPPVNFGA